jgi:hypothetical protein
MEQIAVLDSVYLNDLAAAAAAGLCVSGGAVAAAMPSARHESARGVTHHVMSAGIAAAALISALAGGALIVGGPWAPLVIAAGLGVLAGPPLLQSVCRSDALGVRRRFAILAGLCAIAGSVVFRVL